MELKEVKESNNKTTMKEYLEASNNEINECLYFARKIRDLLVGTPSCENSDTVCAPNCVLEDLAGQNFKLRQLLDVLEEINSIIMKGE